MDILNGWERKELWHKRGDGFCVEVKHHTLPLHADHWSGPDRWCVYAYIYPTHPHFARFDGDTKWQEAAIMLPLHGGPSFLRWHMDTNGNATSVQVGADYNHDVDTEYTYYKTAEDAYSVFRDANELVAWLENK